MKVTSDIDKNINYDLDFLKLKQEISKISDVDYKMIEELSTSFLNNKYKDIRVAGYLILANCYLDNIDKITKSILGYADIISKPNFFPLSIKARCNSVLWLNNNKFLSFAKTKIATATISELKLLSGSINKLNDNIKKLALGIDFKFNILEAEVEKNIHIKLKEEEYKVVANIDTANHSSSDKILDKNKQKCTVTNKSNSTINNISISSETINFNYALEFLVKDTLTSNNSRDISINCSRMLRWSRVKILADNNFRTDFPPLPIGSKKQLLQQIQAENFVEIINTAENLFLVPGGQFSMELQYYIYSAAEKLNNLSIKYTIEFWIQYLVRRFPDIAKYKFRDNSPFVKVKVKDWFNKVAKNIVVDENLAEDNSVSNKDAVKSNISTPPTVLANFIFL